MATVLSNRITVVPKDKVLVHQRRNNAVSLSNTREKSWQCFHEALKKLKQGLVEHGIYKEVEQDYTNYALHFSLWNLNTVSKTVYDDMLNKLKNEWFTEFGLQASRNHISITKKNIINI